MDLELLCICGAKITTPNDSYLCHHCLKHEMSEAWGEWGENDPLADETGEENIQATT